MEYTPYFPDDNFEQESWVVTMDTWAHDFHAMTIREENTVFAITCPLFVPYNSPDASIASFCVEILNLAGSIISKVDHNQGSVSFMTRVVHLGMNMWKYLQEYARSKYAITFQPFGFLSILYAATQVDDGKQSFNTLQSILTSVAVQLGSTLFVTEIEENPYPKYKTPSQEEMDDAMKNVDENLIKEFFTTLQDLGTYHADPDKYETQEELDKHNRLTAIYNKIMEK